MSHHHTSSTPYLPNTALSTIFVSNAEVYTYCQTTDCGLMEISGQIAPLEAGSLPTYAPTGKPVPITLTKQGVQAAKRFTPLASSPMINFADKHPRRYLFYVDCNNYLRDVYEDGGTWYLGSLNQSLNLKCAPYSKLAAIKYTNSLQADFIFLYYQNSDDSGNIQLCGLSHEGWKCGEPPLCDPPLWGTAITATPAEPGIIRKDDQQDPVVFFQQTSLELSSAQDDGTPVYKFYAIPDKTQALSSHGYLAGVDDKTNAWVFFTGDWNYIHRARIGSDGVLKGPIHVGLDRNPIPNSPIAAVITADSPEKIVLFYLLHDKVHHRNPHHPRTNQETDGQTNVYASTLTRISPDSWSASPGTALI